MSTTTLRPMDRVQQRLHALYGGAELVVADFLITDRALAESYAGQSLGSAEQLLLRAGADALEAALYLDQSVLNTLDQGAPIDWLEHNNLSAFLLATEGISHLWHVQRHALAERAITALELELLAEIEKFLLALDLLREQNRDDPRRLHRRLFDQVRFVGASAGELDRYRHANFFAARYCANALQRHGAALDAPLLRAELRLLSRLGRDQKLDFIRALAL